MLKIDTIIVMDKLLKIAHNMEHSRSQLKTYISRISFRRVVLFFWSCEWFLLFIVLAVFLFICCSTNISSVPFN